MDFSRTMFWVQLYNVPLACMTEKAARFLGSIFGEVGIVNLGELGGCDGKFLRVHILINIENLLSTGAKAYLEETQRSDNLGCGNPANVYIIHSKSKENTNDIIHA
ncbi:hypothetical protein Sjap_024185 [Stephania japonica]|uniref:DUF4283 domain-containing protein n=1 Tax=Stephania japonica TaxID=461633 RepID=A0AAP0EI95_9MAGN